MMQRMGVSWTELLEKPNDRRLFMLLTPLCLVAQVVYLWRYRRFGSALWWSGIGFTVLLFLIGPQMWTGSLAAPRVVLPMTIAFNVLLATNPTPQFWIWFIAGNAGLLWGLRKLTIDLTALWL